MKKPATRRGTGAGHDIDPDQDGGHDGNGCRDYLTREEALARLQVKAATLYAYVSRGLLRRRAGSDPRRSLYARADIERLAARRRGTIARAGAAAASLRWGEPVVSTGITYIDAQGPVYRNRPARELARSGASFEAVVHLLLTGVWQPETGAWAAIETPPGLQDFLTRAGPVSDSADAGRLLAAAVLFLGMHGQGAQELGGIDTFRSLRLILQTLAGAFGLLSPARACPPRRQGESIARYVLRAGCADTGAAEAAALDSALVLLADHELAAATFAARVAASTSSDLFNCIAAAICSHAGYAAGVATDRVQERLFGGLSSARRQALLVQVRERGATLFGFDHPLYPDGDPRADEILRLAGSLKARRAGVGPFLEFIEQVRRELGMQPGLAVALVALAQALGLPPHGASALWILARSAGWAAHALEQRGQAFMLRPRARYTASIDGA